MDRREFVGGAAALAATLVPAQAAQALGAHKAEHCIMIWLGGGAAQIDTWDPKRKADPKDEKDARWGSYYDSISTAVPGVSVCEHLPKCAQVMEHITAVRGVHHDVIDEHAAASYRMHTGRPVSGTVRYPSIGSIIAHERGPVDPAMPAYVLIGYPSTMRDPGFLGAKAGYLYLTDTAAGPQGFTRPSYLTAKRTARRHALLSAQRQGLDLTTKRYDAAVAESLRLAGPDFMRVFDLAGEPAELRSSYGREFGQRCLLARRLVERGSRFVEVSHNLNFMNGTGWDTHNAGQFNQHLLIQEMDRALSTLIRDLKQRQMLDRTLIVVNTEFGRPAGFDGGGGRGHHCKAFTVVLAGGGLRHQGAYGVTDEKAQVIVENPVSVPDLFATMHQSLGIDPAKELYDGDRPVPITDGGKPIAALLA